MANITSTYPPGMSRTVVSGTGGPLDAMLALLAAESRGPAGPPPKPLAGGRMIGPGRNLLAGTKSARGESGLNNSYVDPGFKKKKLVGLGFNMTPGYVDEETPGSAGFASNPGPSPAGLSPAPPPMMAPQGPEERPDFFGTGTTNLRAQQALLGARSR